jgi:transcriptional regulator with XRE-family HTH domain
MNWIRQRRQQLGIETQDEFAARLQIAGYAVTRASISHWEKGRHMPPFEDPLFRTALSQVLRMPESEIIRLAGYGVSGIRSSEAERAAYIIDQLSTEQRKLAIKVLEQFLPGST